MAIIDPQMIDFTDANGATTRGHFNILKPTFGERSFDESNKEQRWTQFFAVNGTGLPYETSGCHCSSNTPR
jgi:hypothetical protein